LAAEHTNNLTNLFFANTSFTYTKWTPAIAKTPVPASNFSRDLLTELVDFNTQTFILNFDSSAFPA